MCVCVLGAGRGGRGWGHMLRIQGCCEVPRKVVFIMKGAAAPASGNWPAFFWPNLQPQAGIPWGREEGKKHSAGWEWSKLRETSRLCRSQAENFPLAQEPDRWPWGAAPAPTISRGASLKMQGPDPTLDISSVAGGKGLKNLYFSVGSGDYEAVTSAPR